MDAEREGFTFIALIGLKDTIRCETPYAVQVGRQKGINVRITADCSPTVAKAIAVASGIINYTELDDPNVCMEGPVFYNAMGGLTQDASGAKKVGD